MRGGKVTHGIRDPGEMLMPIQGAGSIFKEMSRQQAKEAVRLIDYVSGTRDNIDAYGKFKGDKLIDFVVDKTNEAVHGVRNIIRDSTTTLSISPVPGDRSLTSLVSITT